MKILVACEFSGTVREELIKRGHDVMSCDLLPSDIPGSHYQGDVRDILNDGWNMMIAHPPCTYLANSGVRWLYNKDKSINQDRWNNMVEAAELFKEILNAPIDKICVENPIQHKHAKAIIQADYDQIIQPWQFGHGETKATCLWLKNLPELEHTKIVEGRENRIHRMPPSEERGRLRSITFQGIAQAMAEQWT